MIEQSEVSPEFHRRIWTVDDCKLSQVRASEGSVSSQGECNCKPREATQMYKDTGNAD